MKIAINKCYGGFGLSASATKLYLKKIGKKCFFYKQTKYEHQGNGVEYVKITVEEADEYYDFITYTEDMGDKFSKYDKRYYWYKGFSSEDRTDKKLIETIEELGEKKASGRLAKLEIVDIPDDVEWEIDDYDGIETVHEKHRSW